MEPGNIPSDSSLAIGDVDASPKDARWYSFIMALVNALRNKDDNARIPEEVQEGAPMPMKPIDRHNAMLQQAFENAGG